MMVLHLKKFELCVWFVFCVCLKSCTLNIVRRFQFKVCNDRSTIGDSDGLQRAWFIAAKFQ